MSASISRPAAQPTGARTSSVRRIVPVLLVAVSLVVALVATGAASPSPVKALTLFSTRCDGVSVRARPSTSSTKLVTLDKGIRVVAVDKVSGGSWRTVCAGTTASGSSWYKLTVVNGKDTKTRYGLTAVYVASSLLRKLYTFSHRKTACDGVSIRTSASTTATRKTILPRGTKVSVDATVTGGSYKTTCAGNAVSGTSWYRIREINDVSVSKLYGVSVVYGAKGLFTTWTSESTAASPTPTPKPTASPTPAPTASATPTATPKPTVSPTPSPTPSPTSTPSSGYWEGIDVSHWQGTIDWAKVKAAGKKFAFIKATESTDFLDDKWATNRAQAKAQGIKVGAYHFARPGTNTGDAVNEANWFVKNANPVSGELLPVLDLEVTGGLTDAQLEAWAKAFLDRVYTLTGVRGAIYTSPSFWSSNVGNSTKIAAAGYKVLWIAHWTSATSPTLPANNWNGNGWTFWQYTSSGTVSGISGRVDLNRYKLTTWSPVLVP